MRYLWGLNLTAFLLLACCVSICQSPQNYYETGDQSMNAMIVSPVTPRDSRGEVVYEKQGDNQKDIPIVTGVFKPPVPLEVPYPRFPKSLKTNTEDRTVMIQGVISRNGQLIDVTIPEYLAADIKKSLLEIVPRYRFRPATRGGEPIAMRITIQTHFDCVGCQKGW